MSEALGNTLPRPAKPGPHRRLATWLAVGCALLGLYFLFSIVRVAIVDPLKQNRDFSYEWSAARMQLRGGNPHAVSVGTLISTELPGYKLDRYYFKGRLLEEPRWHTPTQLALTLPLGLMPYRVAAAFWITLDALCIVVALWILTGSIGMSRTWRVAVSLGALAIPTVRSEIILGQTQGVLLLLLVLTWRELRSGRDARAGLWLGLAAGLKFFPALFFLPLLGRRRWRPVAVASGVAIGALTLGWILTGAHTEVFARALEVDPGWRLSPWNYSWQGLSQRLFPDLEILAYLGSFLFMAGALRPPARTSRDTFWAASPFILLALPIAWGIYLVTMLPWFALALTRGSIPRAFLFGVLAVVLLVSPFSWLGYAATYVPPLALLLGISFEAAPAGESKTRQPEPVRA